MRKLEYIVIDDEDLPSFESCKEELEMLGVTPQVDGLDSVIYLKIPVEDRILEADCVFELNLTHDGKWWLSIDDREAAAREQLLELFKTKFFSQLREHFDIIFRWLKMHPEEGRWTMVGAHHNGPEEPNGSFEEFEETFKLAQLAFQHPEKRIDDYVMTVTRADSSQFDECEGGMSAGTAGGMSAGSNMPASGDAPSVLAGTSSTEVLGDMKPGKGCMGKDDFHVPMVFSVPSRYSIDNLKKSKKKKKKGKKLQNGAILAYDNLDEAKVIDVKNSLKHCKQEKAKLDKKMPMKKAEVVPSKAVSKKADAKQVQLSKAEMNAAKNGGPVVATVADEDAYEIQLGDFIKASSELVFKVIGKKSLISVNQHPFKAQLSEEDLQEYANAKCLAMLTLAPVEK